MTSTEKTAMYIANCHICLLAPAMRDCRNCGFRVGLDVLRVAPKPPSFDLADEQREIQALIDWITDVSEPADVGTCTSLAYGDYDLGTRCVVSGGEVVELGKFTSPVSDDAIPF